jgi:hypothetical protein
VKAVNDRLKRDVFQRIDSYKRGSDASLQRMEGCQNIVDRGEKTAVLFQFRPFLVKLAQKRRAYQQ